MGVQIPAGYGQAVLVFSCAGTPRQSTWTLGFKSTPFVSAGESAENIYNQATAAGGPYEAPRMLSIWTFEGVNVTWMTESGPLVGSFFDPVVGSGGSAGLVINCAGLLKKNTARGGRKGRGRAFIPPTFASEAQVDPVGTIDSGVVSVTQDCFDQFVDDLATAGITPYLLHEDGSTPNEITSLTLQATVATQRRRLR